jgi:ParB family transcriptional regulator, chromosome partitioning protein
MAKKSPLGKGLGALIDTSYEKKPIDEAKSTGAVAEIKLNQIQVNPYQPRTEFDEQALDELAASIKQLGVIQPITVRKVGEKKFQIISGERRFRAAKRAGLTSVVAFVRDANDEDLLAMALVENIQREDLNAIEVGLSYQRLIDECSLTQNDLSERIGKKRSTITNYLRLLKLPPEIQAGIKTNQIGMGHARALVNIEDEKLQLDTFYKIVSEGLSVRDTEKLIREINYPVAKKKVSSNSNPIPEDYKQFAQEISEVFPGSVKVKRNNAGRGSLTLAFTSDKQFDEIKKILSQLKK